MARVWIMLLDIDLGEGITLSFATPLLKRSLPKVAAVNERLREIVLAREKSDKGASISNAGGWQSTADLWQWPEPEVVTLREGLMEAITLIASLPAQGDTTRLEGGFRITAWANINRDRDFNRLHLHPAHHWSGVYYVCMGEPDPSRDDNGAIEFIDPRPGATALPAPAFPFGQKVKLQPEAGMVLMFPSWMQHAVHPFYGQGERISIAFNVFLENFRVRPPG